MRGGVTIDGMTPGDRGGRPGKSASVNAYRVAPTFDTTGLLYDNRQVHASVNGTVQVIGTGGIERSDHMTIAALELYIHRWRAGLGCRFGGAIIPGAILNDVDYRCIVNQVQAATLADGDGGLGEVGAAHVNIGAAPAITTGAATRDKQGCDKAQYYEADYKLFHGTCLSFFGKNVIEYTNSRMPG